MLHRADRYNQTTLLLDALERRAPRDTVILRPQMPLPSFEKDVSVLHRSYDHGYQLAMDNMDAIRALFD